MRTITLRERVGALAPGVGRISSQAVDHPSSPSTLLFYVPVGCPADVITVSLKCRETAAGDHLDVQISSATHTLGGEVDEVKAVSNFHACYRHALRVIEQVTRDYVRVQARGGSVYDLFARIGDDFIEIAKNRPGVRQSAEVYAVRYISNWDGERDILYELASKNAAGKFVSHINDRELLEYQGDEIIDAWPLTPHLGQIHASKREIELEGDLAAARALLQEIVTNPDSRAACTDKTSPVRQQIDALLDRLALDEPDYQPDTPSF